MDKSERQSLRGTVTTLRSSRGAVFVNQDGSYAYICPMKNESIIQNEKVIQEPQQIILPMFGNDEQAFYINTQDLPDFVDEVLDTYITRSRVFLVFMCIQLIIEIIFDSMVWINQDKIEQQLALNYNKVPLIDIHQMIILCFCINILYQCIYYASGITGAWRKSYKILDAFANLSFFGMFLQIFLSYTYQFDILVFTFRVVSCMYAKFLSHLILSLILLPH
ncbi:unnamed protein product [Paramecium primaurelia]|uniref:Uncharacterized protein n=1 Tax=Paramecium primaurelia TaxID=5886 RepID=A0A8S1JXH7_PARPR|nr:unnamed protein product [Paramecium primaurelia]